MPKGFQKSTMSKLIAVMSCLHQNLYLKNYQDVTKLKSSLKVLFSQNLYGFISGSRSYNKNFNKALEDKSIRAVFLEKIKDEEGKLKMNRIGGCN